MAELSTESKHRRTGSGVSLHTAARSDALRATSKEAKRFNYQYGKPREKKKNKKIGISWDSLQHNILQCVYFSVLLHLVFLRGLSPQPHGPSQEYNAPSADCTSGTGSAATSKHKRKKRVSLNAIIIFKKGN